MGSVTDDLSVLQYQNLVRLLNGGDPLGDDDLCGILEIMIETLPDLRLRRRVNSAGGVVEDQNLRAL